MSRISQRRIRSYSIWMEGTKTANRTLKAKHLGAYIGTSFEDACRRACLDRFGNSSEAEGFHIKNGVPYYTKVRLFDNRLDAQRRFG